MFLVPRYVYVGKCTRAASPKKQRTEGLLMKLLQKNKRCTWSQDTYMSVLMYQGYIPPPKNNRRPIDEIAQKKQNKKQPIFYYEYYTWNINNRPIMNV